MFKDSNIHHRHFLKILFSITLLVFAVSAGFYVYFYSQSIQPNSYRSFSVSGEGKAIGVPDIAQFTFNVIIEGGVDIPKLQTENTEKNNKIIEFLKNQGVDSKDIQTQNYNLRPRYTYYPCHEKDECPPPEIVGYTINQSVLIKVRDFDKIGELLEGVVDNGANSVSQFTFIIDDKTIVQNEARAKAIEKARAKAKSIAKAGGFRIGKLLSIEEGGYLPQLDYGFEERALGIGGGIKSATSIEPGSEDVTVSVIMKYEIK